MTTNTTKTVPVLGSLVPEEGPQTGQLFIPLFFFSPLDPNRKCRPVVTKALGSFPCHRSGVEVTWSLPQISRFTSSAKLIVIPASAASTRSKWMVEGTKGGMEEVRGSVTPVLPSRHPRELLFANLFFLFSFLLLPLGIIFSF